MWTSGGDVQENDKQFLWTDCEHGVAPVELAAYTPTCSLLRTRAFQSAA